MDKAIFGDNQFFAVNHLSDEKSRAQAMRFRDNDAIIEVLDYVYELGMRTFMCTTHDRMADICSHIRAHPESYAGFKVYPCMPYAHKYANAVTEHGPIGALKRFIPEGVVGTVAKGGMAVVRKDFETMMKLLVDAEMVAFRGLNTEVIFLQNVVTDLMLGLRLDDLFASFAEHVRSEYGAEPGFITMNMPMLLDVLEGVGVDNPIICASINKIGFRMSGGTALYEQTLRERTFRPIAMQVLAAGALAPGDAIDYVRRQPGIESILYGASTPGHIKQTYQMICQDA